MTCRRLALCCLLFALGLAGGCGQTGPLYLPPPDQPQPGEQDTTGE